MSMHSPRTGRNRWWIIPIIALLAAGTAVLVALALTPNDPPESALIPWTPSPRATTEATAAPFDEVTLAVPQQRFIAAVDDTLAWRTDAGACPTSMVWPELTTTGGDAWARFDASTTTAASGVLSLGAVAEGVVGMVTRSTADCGSYQFTSLVEESWQAVSNEAIADEWYFVPGQGPVAYLLGTAHATPCDPAGIASRGSLEVAVLCADGRVVRSVDGAVTWDDGFAIAGASVITATPDGYLTGGLGRTECQGVELRGLTPSPSNADGLVAGCFVSVATPGNVAMSAVPGALWVWAGTSLGISSDGGATW